MGSFERVWTLLKRQTELGEFHPDFPSSHGPVVYVHGTGAKNIPNIRRKGLIAGGPPVKSWNDGRMEHQGYPGVFVSTEPHVRDTYTMGEDNINSALVGVRAGAGTPEPYAGYGEFEVGDVDPAYEFLWPGRDIMPDPVMFPHHWRFRNTINPKFLTLMPDDRGPDVLPEFYDDEGNPPDIDAGDFSLDKWKEQWGGQTQ